MRGVLLMVLRAHCHLLNPQALLGLLVRGVQAGLTVRCAPSLPGPQPAPAAQQAYSANLLISTGGCINRLMP